MTALSRLAHLGIAKEAVIGTYLAPTTFIPFTKADYEDMFTEIKDTSIRANDSVLQGMYQGPVEADWSIDLLAYPDVTGHFLRGVIGPDTVSAGVSTTVATGGSSIGAATLPSTASIPALSYISIGSGASQEYAYVTAVSGAGPYNLTVTTVVGQTVGLAKAHVATDPIVSRDIVGDDASCIFDSPLTQANGNLAKVFGWYDNEWGYSKRLVDLTVLVGQQL